MSLQPESQKGFTIVELLIVIVVIGILAAITIVAFNGVQNQAKTTKAQAVASDVQKKAESYNAMNSSYPTTSQFSGVAALSSGNNVTDTAHTSTTAAETRENTAVYTRCGSGTGARVSYWSFSNNAMVVHTTMGTGCPAP